MSQGYLDFPNIDPVLISFGPVSIRWYGLMYLVGFVFALWLANRRADKPDSGWTRDQVSDLLFAGFLGVVVGGRVGYVLFYNFDLFLQDPLYLFKVWTGGMSFHGGLLGVITAMFWYAKKNGRTFFGVSILWRSWEYKETAAEALKLTADDMKNQKLIDEIIEEPLGGAHSDRDGAFKAVEDSILKAFNELKNLSKEDLISSRMDKYLDMGVYQE